MDFYKWSDKFSVHLEEMDQQHQKFFKLLNQMYEYNERQDRSPEVLDQLFEELFTYAKVHFEAEEALFGKAGFPESEQHRDQHRFFQEHLLELRREHFQAVASVPRSVFHFMRDWLLTHILEVDKSYGEYLQQPR